MAMLQRESELEELVRLVGVDALPPGDRLVMLCARMIREDFLHQNAFDEVDTYTSPEKQFLMLRNIVHFYRHARRAFEAGADVEDIARTPVLERIARAKLISEEELEHFDEILEQARRELDGLAVTPAARTEGESAS
jgi:V/A-type H+-transporting ATPase subunit A